MAITWGSYDGNLRVGIDISVSGTTITIKYYVGTDGWDYNDSQTLTLTGAVTGTVNFTNNLTSGYMLVATRTKSGDPGDSFNFGANLSGSYLNETPSHTRSGSIPPVEPSQAGRPSISNRTGTSARADWNAPGDWGGENTGDYDLQIAENSGFTGNTQIHQGNRDHTWTNLEPGTTYWTRVRAKNSAGTGPWSTSREFTTLDVPSEPLNLLEAGVTPDSIAFTWEPPADNGGATITSYQHQLSDTDDFSNLIYELTDTDFYRNFTGLQANVTYYIRSRAYNSVGWGPYSTALEVTTLSAGWIKKSGVWKRILRTYVKKNGVWKQALKTRIKKSGTWK